jgi:hypothetical protein
MVARSPQPASVRAIRLGGFISLVGWITWVSARFEARPVWAVSFHEILGIFAWAVGLQLVLRLVEALTVGRGRVSWVGYARVYTLALFCGWTFLWYFNAQRVGPLDAQWYENVTTDYLTQARSGTFPVVVGSTVYAFNGAVHPFRSAPWQFVLANGVDILSGRSLAPVAVEHITAIASFCAAILILYAGFARSRPNAGGTAWLFALFYAMAPAATVPFFQFDMYMTLTAQPVMVAAMLCVQRVVEEDSVVASGWLGVFLAALWYCHPPMALLTGLVAGACAAAGIAVRGITVRRAFGACVGLAAFAVLAEPYFLSMSELAQTEQPRLASLGMPLAGLGLCLFAMTGFLRTRRLLWLALLPTAILCLREFQPSLVPFACCFAAGMLATAWFTRARSRGNDAAWVSLCALVAALVSSLVFPSASIPYHAAGWAQHEWQSFIEPIGGAGNRTQPGYLLWILIGGMIALIFSVQSLFAQISAAAALVLVVSLGFCGILSEFFWRNIPGDIVDVIAIAYDLRLLPVVAVLAVTGGFYWYSSLRDRRGGVARACVFLVLLASPWSLWEHLTVLHNIRGFHLGLEETEIRNRSENVALERYSWDLLPPPRYINWGVMDPVLETRFWSDADHDKAMIDPDQIERSLETPGQEPIKLTATPILTGRDWLTLEPKIELDPGQHVLIRFDFLGKYPPGYLIVQGQAIYREYQLPESGRNYAFGFTPGNTRTLSLWNSGASHESVQLSVDRKGPNAYDPPAPGPYWLMYLTQYEPKRAPIELYSLTPLRLRVDAPTAGYVESFRSLIPGYKVYVDGNPAAVHGSRNALVSVRVPAGSHDLLIRFAGTVRLHTAIRWAETAWLIAGLAAALELSAMIRRPRIFSGKEPAT